MLKYDVAVIGSGPAGMAAALSACEAGADTVLIERSARTGGILNQCVHAGFGSEYFGKEITGPEYAGFFSRKLADSGVKVLLNSFVADVSREKILTVLSGELGLVQIGAKAVVFATGCRERTAGALALAGDRPAGIWTAGAAQRFALDGLLVGREIVILGSGDIGLITARRMTELGAKVKAVCEIMPYSNGNEKNIKECLDDLGIPLLLSSTVTRVAGKPRLNGVFVAKVDGSRKPEPETEEFIPCDCLLLSVGLIPENELSSPLGIEMCPVTGGAAVDEYRHTGVEGFFACGNALHVHDLVDNVSKEAHIAGFSAGLFARGELPTGTKVKVIPGNGIRYALPQKLNMGGGEALIYFRVNGVFRDVKVAAVCGGKEIASEHYKLIAPGKMGGLKIDKKNITGDIQLCLKD